MPLSREQVFDVINKERAYQESTWPSHDGHKNSEHSLLLLDGYVQKAKAAWLTSKNETSIVQQLAKIAAITVRALEHITGSEATLDGLR